jgi:hypothetical protein
MDKNHNGLKLVNNASSSEIVEINNNNIETNENENDNLKQKLPK